MLKNTIYSRFRRWVDSEPEAPAIVGDGYTISYQKLDAMVDSLAWRLGDRRGEYIGVSMEHDPCMISTILAILKSGAAYVPVEPSQPEARMQYMMHRACVSMIIDKCYCDALRPAPMKCDDLSAYDGVAYVLYTSGTTGHPKGVIVTNRNVLNYADAFNEEFHVHPGDVMFQYSVCTFDIFVEEVFTTLLNGGTLAIPSQAVKDGGMEELMSFVERHKVTELCGFPYLLAEMNKLDSLPPTLRLIVSGGDVLRSRHISRLKEMGPMIYNTYGPSETTVCATYCRCDNIDPLSDGTYPIGHPIKGVKIRILYSDMKDAPQGKSGEICIMGEGVSNGYVADPPEQKNFVTLPNGERMYRSGDMGYQMPDGNYVFQRRLDQQVMILGKRVEPEEVEAVLNDSEEVEKGIVRPFVDDDGLSYLVAYFVPAGEKYSVREIKKMMKSELSDFMIPEFFVAVKDIPVNQHGKVDMHALPIVLKEGDSVFSPIPRRV